MPIVFDLKALNTEDIRRLNAFFQLQSSQGINAWRKNIPYHFDDGAEFVFANDVFKRESRSREGQSRYEVISNEPALGAGSFGEVKLIDRTVAFNKGGEPFGVKETGTGGKQRVVKIQKGHIDGIVLAGIESTFSPPDLAMKYPVVSDPSPKATTYLTMRRLPGRELFEICNCRDTLTIEQRIALSKGLLQALKKQVTDRGIIHRDIKPENIMVEMGPPPLIKIIDFGFAKLRGDSGFSCGSEVYIAPENVSPGRQMIGLNSDVYSMARVIALLWNVDLGSYHKALHLSYAPERKLENLFNGICGLHRTVKGLIKTILTGMLSNKPEERLPLDEAIKAFNRIPDSGTEPVLDDVVAPADGLLLSTARAAVGFWPSPPADIPQLTSGIRCGLI